MYTLRKKKKVQKSLLGQYTFKSFYMYTLGTNMYLQVILSCKYDSQARNLQWYQQYPGSRPEFLLLVYESNSVLHAEPPFPRLNASVNKEGKRVYLEISSVAVTDSALYYCALEPTVTGNTRTLYKNLYGKSLSFNGKCPV
uniref:Si:ch211-106g8.17 n=1 Tax=Cyprinus carpio TaxID=7962 RepID=A0A8C1N5P1_CYPCA